jgi:predicted TIM-barrel fold metal-dependent hydrolase
MPSEGNAHVDLSAVPLVDNHCHGFYRVPPKDVTGWRRLFTESRDTGMPEHHVPSMLSYQRLVRQLAEFLGCGPSEAEVLAARQARDESELMATLLRAANIELLIVDTGFPAPELVLPHDEVTTLSGCRVEPILRLEVLMQRLIAEHPTLDAVEGALQAELADVRGRGYVGLKTIVAYRIGLAIREWSRDEAERAFAQARREALAPGGLRLAHKPLLDTLLHVAFTEAARQGVPVQFHTGYGDTDADLRLGNPLHLRAVLEQPQYRGMPVVLLHACYPYTREGAYLAAVYENVFLDLSYGIPFLGYGEMLAFTRAAVGVAPLTKLLYSSDGVGVAELHWLSARDGRRVLGQVLGEAVDQGDLRPAGAEQAGAGVLRENAVRLYRLVRS